MNITFKIFRYTSFVAIFCSLIGSLILFGVGAWETYEALEIIFHQETPEHLEHMQFSDGATTYLLKALDTFLIALVLIIFARGIYSLFISSYKLKDDGVFSWINIPNIGHLKNTLAEVIIVILFVIFLEIIFENLNNLKWEFTIIPISILILALALKFLRLKENEEE
jgi:uncharacterized membrane protein YqhA